MMADEPLVSAEEVASVLSQGEEQTDAAAVDENSEGSNAYSLRRPVAISPEAEPEAKRRAHGFAQALVDTLCKELETEIDCAAEAIREREHRAGRNRERITQQEAAEDHQRKHMLELAEEERRYRSQLVALNSRARDIRQRVEETRHVLDEARAEQGGPGQRRAVRRQGRRCSLFLRVLPQTPVRSR